MFGQPVKRRLRYVDAAVELSVIERAITEPGEKAEGDTGASTSTGSTQPTGGGAATTGGKTRA